jgi:hypothetical protein
MLSLVSLLLNSNKRNLLHLKYVELQPLSAAVAELTPPSFLSLHSILDITMVLVLVLYIKVAINHLPWNVVV